MYPLVIGGALLAYYLYKTRNNVNHELPDADTPLGSDKLHPDTEQNSVSNVERESPNTTKGRSYGHQGAEGAHVWRS